MNTVPFRAFLAITAIAISVSSFAYTPVLSSNTPKEWGEHVSGVKTMLDTTDKVIALTLDACGGKSGCGYDKKLIEYLQQEKIPATLFINSRWIDANADVFLQLSKDPLFEIENHGTQHKPLSVNGRSAYEIKGTRSIQEVLREVTKNADKIARLTAHRPHFFRSGTAYCDEIAVKAVCDLGYEVVGFSVLGDAGGTYSKEQIEEALLSVKPGSIVICHMNHPEKQIVDGIQLAVPKVLAMGYSFVKLEDYQLK